MTAPLCKICGERHFAYEDHAWAAPAPAPQATAPGPPSSNEAAPAPPYSAGEAVSSIASKSRFDRKSYMRKYMRSYLPKWRAKRKKRK